MQTTPFLFRFFSTDPKTYFHSLSALLVNCLGLLGIILLSVLISVFFIIPEMPQNKFIYDAGGYYFLSLEIENWGQFYSSIRTFGYPLFLYLVRQFALLINVFPWITVLCFVQFSLHTLTSFLTLATYKNLLVKSKNTYRPTWGLIIFAISQLNLILIPFAFELLTESLAIFLFTAAIFLLSSSYKYRNVLMGSAMGLASLVRPFYGPLSFFVGFAILLCAPRTTKTQSDILKSCIPLILQFWIPFFLVCSPQLYLIYKHEHRFSLVGDSAKRTGETHLNLSQVILKFESHGLDTAKPLIVYWDEERKRELKEPSSCTSLFSCFLKNPWGSTRMALLKTIALFQNFEWSVYRTSHNPRSNHPGLLYGLLHFFLFLNLILALFRAWLSKNKMRIGHPGVLGGLLIVLHVFLYSILTVPESRYIAPALPALIALGSYFLSNLSSAWRFFSVLLACFSYVFTFCLLKDSVYQINFTELYNLISK